MLSSFVAVLPVYPLDGDTLPDPGTIDGAIFLGSHYCVHDPVDGLREERAWLDLLLGNGTPVLGICFGAQLIGLAAGGRVSAGARPERGEGLILPAMGQDFLRAPMRVMQWHQDGIFDLPHGIQVIATGSTEYPNQAFKFGSALGVQFHPEATPGMLDRWIDSEKKAAPDGADYGDLHARLANMHEMQRWLSGLTQRLFAPA